MIYLFYAERDGFPFPFWCSPLAALCSLSKTEHAPGYYIIIELPSGGYHQNLPEDARLIPWGPPNQRQPQNSFHARNDSVEID
ncbi:hypothetical protein VN97_g11203 [Penicillium thymicola]|uniref:Uncharacterized protein n=1 Tax=Penicillium thymicola TaxID=293382 RepID=A0AAI9X3N6_PENTH|nr:hypothetical protein VN97_g11203 [Penicillium thymicola]